MSLAGTGRSLVDLLEQKYVEDYPADTAPSFKLVNTSSLEEGVTDSVTVFLYRVDVDPTKRHRTVEPLHPGEPVRVSLSLDVRFLLTAWMTDAARELQVLQNCIAIFERNAILSGDLLADGFGFTDDDALKITLESLTTEDMMRIWDAVTPSFRLSIPYVVRTVRLPPDTRPTAPLVETATRVLVPRVSP